MGLSVTRIWVIEIRKQLGNCWRSSWDLRWQTALSEKKRSVDICGCGEKFELWVTFGMGYLELSC